MTVQCDPGVCSLFPLKIITETDLLRKSKKMGPRLGRDFESTCFPPIPQQIILFVSLSTTTHFVFQPLERVHGPLEKDWEAWMGKLIRKESEGKNRCEGQWEQCGVLKEDSKCLHLSLKLGKSSVIRHFSLIVVKHT